jgi:DNA-binding transcriptional MerR regulator
MAALSIGKLAKAADVKVPTIRFYEQIGLLPVPDRTESDRRVYEQAAVGRLAFIKHARQLGFGIEAIRTLLDLADHPERACNDANALAQEQLEAVEAKITQLEALRSELKRMVGLSNETRIVTASGFGVGEGGLGSLQLGLRVHQRTPSAERPEIQLLTSASSQPMRRSPSARGLGKEPSCTRRQRVVRLRVVRSITALGARRRGATCSV